MRWMTLAGLVLGAMVLAGCATKFKTYDGPQVTRVVVFKEDRRMYLLHNDRVLRTFDVDLGFAPEGHKTKYGDGRTPEGQYYIDRRNPDSAFHLSIGISYPNARDVAQAKKLGVDPGGNIFIHGTPSYTLKRGPDWTWGCIAVTNEEMEDIYAMVRTGTAITIHP